MDMDANNQLDKVANESITASDVANFVKSVAVFEGVRTIYGFTHPFDSANKSITKELNRDDLSEDRRDKLIMTQAFIGTLTAAFYGVILTSTIKTVGSVVKHVR